MERDGSAGIATGAPTGEVPASDLSHLPVAPSTLVRVDTDRRCVSCGYKLIGLDRSGMCPECATPVAQSLSPWVLGIVCDLDVEGLINGLRWVRLSVWPMALGVPLALASRLLTDTTVFIILLVPTYLGVGGASVLWAAGWSKMSCFPFPPWRHGASRLRSSVRAASLVFMLATGFMMATLGLVVAANWLPDSADRALSVATAIWLGAALWSVALGHRLLRLLVTILPDNTVVRQSGEVSRLIVAGAVATMLMVGTLFINDVGTAIVGAACLGVLIALAAGWTAFLGTLIEAVEAQRWHGA